MPASNSAGEHQLRNILTLLVLHFDEAHAPPRSGTYGSFSLAGDVKSRRIDMCVPVEIPMLANLVERRLSIIGVWVSALLAHLRTAYFVVLK